MRQEILYAFDCGSTNWRIFRVNYQVDIHTAVKQADPSVVSLYGFDESRLPAVLVLSPDEKTIDSYGRRARGKPNSIDCFKPCIGSYLQKRKDKPVSFSNADALRYTGLLLKRVLKEIREHQYAQDIFGDDVRFSFAYPVHWEGDVLADFREAVLGCFDEGIRKRVRFVSEPAAALLNLQHSGQFKTNADQKEVVLIVDVGGSTTDLIAGEYDPQRGELRIIGTEGAPHGGMDYDEVLLNIFLDDLGIKASDSRNHPELGKKLRNHGEELKEALSDEISMGKGKKGANQLTQPFIFRLSDGRVLNEVLCLDEEKFRRATRTLTEEFAGIVTEKLAEFGLKEEEVAQVVLVGGGVRLFTIEEHLKERFGRVITATAPVEAVVCGVALEYGRAYPPRLEVEPERLDFGVVREGQERPPIELHLWNSGIAELHVKVEMLTGALQVEEAEFTLKEGEIGTCRVRLVEVKPAEGEEAGVEAAGLRLESNGGMREVAYHFAYDPDDVERRRTEVEQGIFKALAKDPHERFEDMGAFTEAKERAKHKAEEHEVEERARKDAEKRAAEIQRLRELAGVDIRNGAWSVAEQHISALEQLGGEDQSASVSLREQLRQARVEAERRTRLEAERQAAEIARLSAEAQAAIKRQAWDEARENAAALDRLGEGGRQESRDVQEKLKNAQTEAEARARKEAEKRATEIQRLRELTGADIRNGAWSAAEQRISALEQLREEGESAAVSLREQLRQARVETERRVRQEAELQAAQQRMIEISSLKTIVLHELEHANWKAAREALAKLDSYGQEGPPIAVELRERLEHSKEEAERLAAEKRVQREAEKRTQQETERRVTEIAHLKAVIESSLKKEGWANAEKALAKLMIQGEEGRLLSLELQATLEQAKQENKQRETEKRAELTHFKMEAETALQNEDWSKLNANIAELKQRGHEGRSIANILLKQMKPIRRQKGANGKPLWLRWAVLVAASFIFLLIIQIFGRQFISWPLATNSIFGAFNAVNSGDQDLKTTPSSDMTTAPGLEKESDSSVSGMTQEPTSLVSYDEKSSVVITESDLTSAMVQALQQNTDIPLKDVEITLNNEQINLSGVVEEGDLQGQIQITAKVDVLACKPKLKTPSVLLNAIPLPEVLFARYLSVAEDSLHTLITTLGDEDLCIISILVDEGKMIIIRDRSIATHLPPTTTPKPSERLTPTLSIGSTQVSPEDGMVMVYVPAGEFIMGSDTGAEDEKPQRKVTLEAFWIDQTEVTNAMYARCFKSGVCRGTQWGSMTMAGYEDYPVGVNNWDQAQAYCGWVGRRLPTEAEWEKAARGTDGRTYPWGEGFDCNKANKSSCGVNRTAPVGSYPQGASPYGALDMAGNLWEWVADVYPGSTDYMLKGGDWQTQGWGVRPAVRGGDWLAKGKLLWGGSWVVGDYCVGVRNYGNCVGRGSPGIVDVGFRCVLSP